MIFILTQYVDHFYFNCLSNVYLENLLAQKPDDKEGVYFTFTDLYLTD